jgi:hypothetical protein
MNVVKQSERFSWIPFYQELARVLVEKYPSPAGQQELIDFLEELRSRGLVVTPLSDSGDEAGATRFTIKEIDPFTFFAVFNRGTKDANRIEICTAIKARLQISSDVPDDFDGLPTLNNMKSWFFPFAYLRENWHIPVLWEIADQAINNNVNENTFDRCLQIPNVARNLTIGLFWINPLEYLSLDGIMGQALGYNPQPGFSWVRYQEALGIYRAKFGRTPYYATSFHVWRQHKPRHWIFNANPDKWDVIRALKDGAMETWQVNQNTSKIAAGDLFALYVTGSNRGVYALGTVKTDPDVIPDDERSGAYRIDMTPDRSNQLRAEIGIDISLVDAPIDYATLSSDPILSSAAFGTQGTNIALDHKAWKRLESIAKGEETLETTVPVGSMESPAVNEQSSEAIGGKARNVILYGPPGTGKTYSVVNYSLSIVDRTDMDAAELAGMVQTDLDRLRFRQLVHDGQIEFVTFHQSFSYEDFVEGIRPRLSEDDGTLSYRLVAGVLKRIAHRALRNYRDAQKSKQQLNRERTAEEVVQAFADYVSEQVVQDDFRINDKVYIMEVGTDYFRYTGEAWQRHSGGIRMKFDDLIEMYTADVQTRQDVVQMASLSGLARQHASYYFMMYQRLKGFEAKTMTTTVDVDHVARKEFVLVVDEINRGNVSRILGELITLLESDKRLDAVHELSVTLPYSQERFTLPPNLHIIGTMNTADRSLTALDTALRRRFEFVHIGPDPSLLKPLDIEGVIVDLELLLTRVNERIEERFDSDHLIGHAWLMGLHGIEDLASAFRYRIVPLLEEYFYDQPEHIRQVIASTVGTLFSDGSSGVTLGRYNYKVLNDPLYYQGLYLS